MRYVLGIALLAAAGCAGFIVFVGGAFSATGVAPFRDWLWALVPAALGVACMVLPW